MPLASSLNARPVHPPALHPSRPAHSQDLKAALLEHGRLLAECKRFGALLEYCLFALGVTDDMPHWDADAHNKVGTFESWHGCARCDGRHAALGCAQQGGRVERKAKPPVGAGCDG